MNWALAFLLAWIDVVLIYTIYRYLRYSDWALYLQGRLLVVQKFCLLALSTTFLIGIISPPYALEPVLLFISALLIAGTVTGMLIALIDAQNAEQDSKTPPRGKRGAIPDDRLWRTRPPVRRQK